LILILNTESHDVPPITLPAGAGTAKLDIPVKSMNRLVLSEMVTGRW
jgi:hypothetical protein